MEGDGLAQIVQALEAVHHSSSTHQKRREAQDVSIGRRVTYKSIYTNRCWPVVFRNSERQGRRALLGLAISHPQEQ